MDNEDPLPPLGFGPLALAAPAAGETPSTAVSTRPATPIARLFIMLNLMPFMVSLRSLRRTLRWIRSGLLSALRWRTLRAFIVPYRPPSVKHHFTNLQAI